MESEFYSLGSDTHPSTGNQRRNSVMYWKKLSVQTFDSRLCSHMECGCRYWWFGLANTSSLMWGYVYRVWACAPAEANLRYPIWEYGEMGVYIRLYVHGINWHHTTRPKLICTHYTCFYTLSFHLLDWLSVLITKEIAELLDGPQSMQRRTSHYTYTKTQTHTRMD